MLHEATEEHQSRITMKDKNMKWETQHIAKLKAQYTVYCYVKEITHHLLMQKRWLVYILLARI